MTTKKPTARPTGAAEEQPVRAGLYLRISRDRTGAGVGVERQEADCRALAERLGWDVVAVFIDNDVSAYSGKPRPQYRALLEAVRAGAVNGVIAWHPDRLHRRTAELEEFVAVAEAHQLQIQTVSAGMVDLTTPSGRMIARMLGAAAQHEVDHARERIRRAKAQAAADGKYRGGRRPFGYEADGVTVRESEAKVIRDAAQHLLAGRSLAAIARDLNEDGVTTTYGKAWDYAKLKEVLIRPRNAGLLHRGRPDRPQSPFEIVGAAQWPAILDEDVWRAIFALLVDASRQGKQTNEPKWLGAGIYVCGLCGSAMRAAPYGSRRTKRDPNRRYYLYRCEAAAHLTTSADATDEYVRQQVADLVRDPRVIAAMEPGQPNLTADRERRQVLSTRLEGFETDYAHGHLTGAQLAKSTALVTAEIEDIDARLAEGLRRSSASPITAAEDPGQAFLDAPVDVQRAVLATILRVEVLPAQKNRAPKWTPERLRLTPVTGDDEPEAAATV